ncbi:D-glycero-beta-D-manno-heptose 1,7-bisphosphate 7-phosphatase [Acidihalobacter prosperus]
MKLIVLDRDGVINEDSDAYVKSPEEWVPIPGSLEAIARLNEAGYRVVVATNQSGIARGLFDVETLAAMHEKMNRLLASHGGRIDAVFFCPHGPDDACDCRKPSAGLFTEIARRYDADLTGVPAVGDSLRDIEAALMVDAQPMLVRTGKGERTLASGKLPEDVPVFENLAQVAATLVSEESE